MFAAFWANGERVLTYEHRPQLVLAADGNGDVRSCVPIVGYRPPQAGRRRRQPHLRLHPASRQLPDAPAEETGTRGDETRLKARDGPP